MRIAEYHTFLRGLFYNHLQKVVKNTNGLEKFPGKGIIKFTITLKNNDILTFSEDWLTENNKLLERVRYSYKYITPMGCFFRYDMEGITKRTVHEQLRKPDCHIHIGILKEKFDENNHDVFLKEDGGPHYKTHCANIVDVLGAIVTTFYEDECSNLESCLDNNKHLIDTIPWAK